MTFTAAPESSPARNPRSEIASLKISIGVLWGRIPKGNTPAMEDDRTVGFPMRSELVRFVAQCDFDQVGRWWPYPEVTIFTRVGIKRIATYAFQLAQARPRKLLTYVTKSNAMRNGMVLWDEVINEVAKDFPDVVSAEDVRYSTNMLTASPSQTMDHMLVDAMTVRMTLHPESLDTILATNLHADILSDLAAGESVTSFVQDTGWRSNVALAGSIGIAPTANIDPSRTMPSMFEPIHGSAFDITGMGIANPVGTFWSACEMLDWLGEHEAAAVVMKAIEKTCASGVMTKDLGGSANTKEVTRAVIEAIMSSWIGKDSL
jgi:tartrate dehydrogenase/decarboxylase/D-malate dehydrogenase